MNADKLNEPSKEMYSETGIQYMDDSFTNDIEETVTSVLDRFKVEYEIVRVDPRYADTAVFCEQYGYELEHCGNTIIVASKKEPKQFAACIVKGSDRLDVNKTVRKLMGVSRLSFASPDETKSLTGMMIGGVTPFALPDDMPIYADTNLLEMEYLILGSGSRSSKLIIQPNSISKIPNVTLVKGIAISR